MCINWASVWKYVVNEDKLCYVIKSNASIAPASIPDERYMICHGILYDVSLYQCNDIVRYWVWCDVMWCDVMCCAVLCCAMLCYAMIWYDMIWYDMIWYDISWYVWSWQDRHYCISRCQCMQVRYGMVFVWHDMLWYVMVLVHYNTVRPTQVSICLSVMNVKTAVDIFIIHHHIYLW